MLHPGGAGGSSTLRSCNNPGASPKHPKLCSSITPQPQAPPWGREDQAEPHHGWEEGPGSSLKSKESKGNCKAALRKLGWLLPCDLGWSQGLSWQRELKVPLSHAGAGELGIRFSGIVAEFPAHKTGGFAMKMWVLLAFSASSGRRMSFV